MFFYSKAMCYSLLSTICFLQVSLTVLMVSIGTIDQLIDGFTFASLFFYILSISAVIILRITRRKEPRLFKVQLTSTHQIQLILFHDNQGLQ